MKRYIITTREVMLNVFVVYISKLYILIKFDRKKLTEQVNKKDHMNDHTMTRVQKEIWTLLVHLWLQMAKK